jgi:membrane protein insertase Oxa1/YidC/SpoIIIJ
MASRHLCGSIKCVTGFTAKSLHTFSHRIVSPRNGGPLRSGLTPRYFSVSSSGSNVSEAAAAAAATSLSDTSLSAANPVNVDAIVLAVAPVDKSALSDIGLIAPDLGYSPTQFVMQAVEQVHLIGELPYWQAIIISTLTVRLILLPSAIWVARDISQMKALQPDVRKIKESFGGVTSAEDPTLRFKFVAKVQELFKVHNLNPFRTAALSFLQFPVFLSIFIGLKNMGDYYPQFSSGGDMWFVDLSASDPYMILPAVNAMTFLLMVEIGTSSTAAEQKNLKTVSRAD